MEQGNDDCTLHIHGKGLHMKGERQLQLYLFYGREECVGIWQGIVDNVNPAVNYRLYFTREDVIVPENFDKINGIILESELGHKYAAVWNEGSVDVGQMRVLRPDPVQDELESADETAQAAPREEPQEGAEQAEPQEEMQEGAEQAEPQEEMQEGSAELPFQEVPQSGGDELSFQEELQAGPEGMPLQEELQGGNGELSFQEEHVSQEELTGKRGETDRPEENDKGNRTQAGRSCETHRHVCSDQKDQQAESHFRCTKVQRNELAVLPRCEWKWANNSFLLHGYYNYRHLAFIDDGEKFRLGVPGIYHPQEAKAASSFGFTEFIPQRDIGIDLSEDEKSDEEQFGYWCRPIKRPLKM